MLQLPRGCYGQLFEWQAVSHGPLSSSSMATLYSSLCESARATTATVGQAVSAGVIAVPYLCIASFHTYACNHDADIIAGIGSDRSSNRSYSPRGVIVYCSLVGTRLLLCHSA
jgi:hypothetical protein